ncbi:type II secretion system F family protein [Roseiconus nitratireducens]|uniref:type II secretion system F family protein n=1 Tax=Roseiconus nitratireducens TaxID=2605748 RepID=UPI0013762EE7|nr:type II secretion system F family protein [Roseiconus nitratireducens]
MHKTSELCQRIDQVRSSNPELGTQLRQMAAEMPASRAGGRLTQLAGSLEDQQPAEQIVRSYPELCWLLTMPSSGAAMTGLTGMLEQTAFDGAMRQKKLRSVLYPVMVMMLAIGLLLVGCYIIVPTFDEMFMEFGLRLPPHTELVLKLSRLVAAHPWLVAAAVLALGVCVAAILWGWVNRTSPKRRRFRSGSLIESSRYALARVAMQLAELIDDNVPLPRALRIASQGSTDLNVSNALADLAERALEGSGAFDRSRAAVFLPPNFVLALAPGQPTASAGPNTTLLRQLAANYRDLSVHRKDWTSFILGQFAVLFVGLMVLFIIVSLFAPMFSLITGLS